MGAMQIVIALTRSIRYVCAGRGKRDGRPVPYEMFLGAYLANGTLPSGEGGNDTQGTLHEKSGGTADPSGEGGNDRQGTGHAFVAGHAGRGGTQAAPYGEGRGA